MDVESLRNVCIKVHPVPDRKTVLCKQDWLYDAFRVHKRLDTCSLFYYAYFIFHILHQIIKTNK